MSLLRLLVSMESRVVRLARGEHPFEGDDHNAAHRSNTGRSWDAPIVWRKGLRAAADRWRRHARRQEGVVLSGNKLGCAQHTARPEVQAEGVSFDSMHFHGGSVTMAK